MEFIPLGINSINIMQSSVVFKYLVSSNFCFLICKIMLIERSHDKSKNFDIIVLIIHVFKYNLKSH